MLADHSRLLLGLATCYDVPALDDRKSWSAEQFADFVDLEVGLPLRVSHGPIIDEHGYLASIGTCRRFANVAYPVAGLLVLAEVDEGGRQDQLLSDLRSQLDQVYLPSGWGLSLAAHIAEDGTVLPFEVSITSRPAYPVRGFSVSAPQL